MRDRKSAMSFVSDRTIGSKVAAGFAVVLLILAVSSVLSWLSFGRVGEAARKYAQLVAVSDIYQQIDTTLVQYRGQVREYIFSNDEATADAAVKDGEALRKLIANGLALAVDPARRALLEDMVKQEQSYTSGFIRSRSSNLEQDKVSAELESIGNQLAASLSGIVESATKAGNAEAVSMAADTRRISLVTRLDAAKRLNAHDEAAGKSVEKGVGDLRQTLARLDTATKGTEINAAVSPLTASIDRWQSAFQRAVNLDTEQLEMLNGSMRQAGDTLIADAQKATDANLAEQATVEKETLAASSNGSNLTMLFGVAALVIGAALAWLIGHGISRPVVRMCAVMRALADGDKTVEIPNIGRKDEIGQMADAVQIFKQGIIEADRQREANERQKAEAETERKAGMIRLADTFEASIKGVVNAVASQATDMQSAAQAMSHTAGSATEQATAVAAAVEQASANVQTVATAAEELSASVLEIGRQVEQSSKIAGQAVVEADHTNDTVEGLDRTAQRIGEVVQLIETIAGQTNLLALNATIEAARAGDAGKGFAVVASEVKSLASQTAKATEEIRGQIGEIQGATSQAVQAIHTIGATIRQMNEIATTIASAVEEQGAATREIATNVHQAAQGTSAIASNIEGVSRAAQETGAAASQVLGSAGELSRQSVTLRSDVEHFLSTVRAA
ncbi:MAG TPA: methyl-accepting chemotaxis protein [Acetobacteraceae bacterium]|nr:methyl-accepting chemotaxis protein [Acetobacteraceae bacterium]